MAKITLVDDLVARLRTEAESQLNDAAKRIVSNIGPDVADADIQVAKQLAKMAWDIEEFVKEQETE